MILVSILVYVIALILIFGCLCMVTGQSIKGNQIVINCVASFVILLIIMAVTGSEWIQNSTFGMGFSLIGHAKEKGGIITLLTKYPGMFAIDFIGMVTLVMLIQWMSNLISFSAAGIAGKITSSLIVVLVSVLLYGFLMAFVQDNIILKWCVYAVESLLTVGSIIYTPAMLITSITGWSSNNYVVEYIISTFPDTSIGKAASTAVSTTVVIVVFLAVIEKQYGSIFVMAAGMKELIQSVGAIVIILFGFYFMIRSLKG